MGKIGILIVDNKIEFLKSFENYLTNNSNNFLIEKCTTTQDALKLIKNNNFQIIISNHVLPKINSIKLITLAKEKDRSTSFIFYLNSSSDEVVNIALHHKADFHLVKNAELEKQFSVLFMKIVELVETQMINEKEKLKQIEQNQNRIKEPNLLQNFFDTSGVINIVLNEKQEVQRINEKGCNLLGYPIEEIIGKNWIKNFIPYKQKEHIEDVFNRCLIEDVYVKNHENYILGKDGKEYLISWRNSLIKDDDGKTIGVLSSGIDITYQNEIQEKLKESEKRYRFFFENLLIPVGITNTSGKILKANKALKNLLGYGEDIFDMDPSLLYFDQHDLIEMNKILQEYKKVENFETKIRLKNEDVLDARFNIITLYDVDNETYITTIEDITKQKQLIKEQSELLTALDQIHESIVITNFAGKIIYVNSGFESFTGYTLLDAIGATPAIMRYYDEEYTEEFYKEIREITCAGNTWQGTVKIKRKDGELRYGERIITPIKDDKEKCTHFVAATRDITEQKNNCQKMIEIEKRYRVILENIQDVFFVTNKDGAIIDFSTKAEKLFGFPHDELLQLQVSDLYANKEDRKKLLEALQNKGKVENYLLKMRRRDGSIFPISLNAYLRKNEKKQSIEFIGILRDISYNEVL
ncbi:MAG: PAS domain S-box protein [Candidatus Heimdallarchaeota archaeon]